MKTPIAAMAWKSCIACFFDMTLTDVAYIVKSSPYSILTAAASAGHKNWPFTSIKEGTFSMGWEDISELRSRCIRRASGELASMLVHAQRTGHMRRSIHDASPATTKEWRGKCKKKKKKKAAFTPKRTAKVPPFLRVVIKEPAPPVASNSPPAPPASPAPSVASDHPTVPPVASDPPTVPPVASDPPTVPPVASDSPPGPPFPYDSPVLFVPPSRAFEPRPVLAGVVYLQRVLTPLQDCLPTDGLEPAIWGRKVEWLNWE